VAEYGMERSTTTQQENVQKPTVCRKADVYSFWDSKAQYWNIIRREAQH
jgi:hypothetical protein